MMQQQQERERHTNLLTLKGWHTGPYFTLRDSRAAQYTTDLSVSITIHSSKTANGNNTNNISKYVPFLLCMSDKSEA